MSDEKYALYYQAIIDKISEENKALKIGIDGLTNHLDKLRIENEKIIYFQFVIDDLKSEIIDLKLRIKKDISDIKFSKLAICPACSMEEYTDNVPCECSIFKDIEEKAWEDLLKLAGEV